MEKLVRDIYLIKAVKGFKYPYVIVHKDTGEILDNNNNWGYKTISTALNSSAFNRLDKIYKKKKQNKHKYTNPPDKKYENNCDIPNTKSEDQDITTVPFWDSEPTTPKIPEDVSFDPNELFNTPYE